MVTDGRIQRDLPGKAQPEPRPVADDDHMIDSSRLSPWVGIARRVRGYVGMSAVASLLSYLLLTVCAGWLGVPLVAANVVAEVGGAVIGFTLNRRYVWQGPRASTCGLRSSRSRWCHASI
jgi:hypothetical protein